MDVSSWNRDSPAEPAAIPVSLQQNPGIEDLRAQPLTETGIRLDPVLVWSFQPPGPMPQTSSAIKLDPNAIQPAEKELSEDNYSTSTDSSSQIYAVSSDSDSEIVLSEESSESGELLCDVSDSDDESSIEELGSVAFGVPYLPPVDQASFVNESIASCELSQRKSTDTTEAQLEPYAPVASGNRSVTAPPPPVDPIKVVTPCVNYDSKAGQRENSEFSTDVGLVRDHQEASIGGPSEGRLSDTLEMAEPWNLQGFNPQGGSATGSAGAQVKLYNPATFQNEQIANQQNGGMGQSDGAHQSSHGQASGDQGKLPQSESWNQAWGQWDQGSYGQAGFGGDASNQWYQPVSHDGQGWFQAINHDQQHTNGPNLVLQQNQAASLQPQHPMLHGQGQGQVQAGYDWNAQYNAADWQQSQPQQQGPQDWQNPQYSQPAEALTNAQQYMGFNDQYYQGNTSGYNDPQASYGTNNNNSEMGGEVGAGLNSSVETGQHEQIEEDSPNYPISGGQLPKVQESTPSGNQSSQHVPGAAPPAQAKPEKPVLFSSSSFSKLPHTPSPFDEISGGDTLPDMVASHQNKHDDSLLAAASNQFSPSHSRDSSMGGNVQFIVGSGASSLSNSVTHSPFPAQRSPNDSPKSADQSQEKTQPPTPAVPVGLPLPPEPHRMDQGEGVMASGQSQQYYEPQQLHFGTSVEYNTGHTTGNATGTHQTQPQHQGHPDFAAHGNWHTYQDNQQSASQSMKHVRPPSNLSDAASDRSEHIGLKASVSESSAGPVYQRSNSQQSAQSVDSLNNAFGILPSPHAHLPHGSPHSGSPAALPLPTPPPSASSLPQPTPPLTGPSGVGDGASPHPTPHAPPSSTAVGAQAGTENPFRRSTPRNMTHRGATPTSQAQHSGSANPSSGNLLPTTDTVSPLIANQSASSDQVQPDVVPPQDFIPSPVGAATNTLAGNLGDDIHPLEASADHFPGSQAGAMSENFIPESTSSPLKPHSIVTPEDAQPAPGRPLSLDVHHKPGNTNAAPTSPEHQLSIYATPIQPHPDSPFQPPQKAASPAGSDLTANYHSLAGPANMPSYQPPQSGSAHPQAFSNAASQVPHLMDNNIPTPDLQPKNSPAAGLPDTVNQPANRKQLMEEPGMKSHIGESAGPVTVAHHMHVHRKHNSLSPAATLWENPTPANPVHLVKAAPLSGQMPTGQPNTAQKQQQLPKNILQPVEPEYGQPLSSAQTLGENRAIDSAAAQVPQPRELPPQGPQNLGAPAPQDSVGSTIPLQVPEHQNLIQTQPQQPGNLHHHQDNQHQQQQLKIEEQQLQNQQRQQQSIQNQPKQNTNPRQELSRTENPSHAFVPVKASKQEQLEHPVGEGSMDPMPPTPSHMSNPTQSQSDRQLPITSEGGNVMPPPAAPQPAQQSPSQRDQRQPQDRGNRYDRQESQYSSVSDDSISKESRDTSNESYDRRHDSRQHPHDRRPDHDRSKSSRYDDRYHDSRYNDSYSRQSRDPHYHDRHHRYYDDRRERPSSRGPGYERSGSRPNLQEEEYERPRSRQSQYHPDDRPRSRQGYPEERPRSRQGPEDRPRSRQGPADDPYYRPRSRQGYEDNRPPSRPSSRQSDRPPSRQGEDDYRQSSRRSGYDEYGYRKDPYYRRQDDYYRDYHRSRSGDYGYQDYYGNRDYDYYYGRDRRGYDDRYYPYYQDNRYARGYLEEMQSYGQQYDYHQGDLEYDRRSYHSASRGSTPGPELGPGLYGYGYGGEAYSDQSVSRGSTPGLPHPVAMYQQQQQQQQHQSVNYDPRYGYAQQAQEYDRRSHHTGSRSNTPSADRTGADQFAREFHQGSRPSSRSSGYEQSPISGHQGYHDYYGNHPGYYGDQSQQYGDHSSYWSQQEYGKRERGRMTPAKFPVAHVKVSFNASGHMIKVLPNRPADGQPAQVEILEVDSDLKLSPEAEEMHLYPGPLVKGETHKNDVLLYCRKKSQECYENVALTDRDSAVLMWNYLELLIKHNGVLLGTDVADLLLDGHEPSTAEYRKTGIAIRQSTARSTPETDDGTVVTSDRSLVNKTNEDELTDRFRHLVLHGRKKDALEWSMKNNLWGHALFLASKMDPKTHASIMTRFANTAMKMNDPLQTLYQLMSGRQPAAVTLVADDKWGDWRPHLAMMLANNSSKPELDRKSLVTLGDTLATKGCLFASQFCYLMAQVPFGVYSKNSSKIVLIGSSHSSSPSFAAFATNEAIQCTEVYEYAQALGNSGCSLPGLQPYKFIYATRLVDYGLVEESLHYCEVLANNILQMPTQYTATLVRQVYELANKLKFNDPQRLHTGEDCGDPFWLQQLQTVLQRFDDGLLQTASGTDTPTVGAASTAASSEIGELTSGMGEQNQVYGQQYGQVTDQYNQQYGQYGYQQNYDPSQSQQTWNQSGWDMSGQWGAQTQQWDPSAANYDGSYLQYQQQPADGTQAIPSDQNQNQGDPQETNQPQQEQQQQYHQYQGAGEDTADHPSFQAVGGRKIPDDINLASSMNSNATEATVKSQATSSSEDTQTGESTPSVQPSNNYWNSHQPPPPAVDPTTSDNSDTVSDTTSDSTPRGSPILQSAPQPHPKDETHKKDTISNGGGTVKQLPPYLRQLGKSSKSQPKEETEFPSPSSNGFDSQISPSATAPPKELFEFGVPPSLLTQNMKNAPLGVGPANSTHAALHEQNQAPQTTASDKQPPPPNNSHTKDDGKNKPTNNGKPGGGGSGWLGGFMKKILPRGKNEMILPDDSKPSIVWDDDKKQWIDTTKSEEEQAVINAPPPKDSELPTGTPPATPLQPATGPPSAGTPTNKFSRQGAKNKYVDVLRGSASKAAPTNPNLFNVMPKSHTVPANLFIPSMSEGAREPVKQAPTADATDQQQPQLQQEQQHQQQDYQQQQDYSQQHQDYNQQHYMQQQQQQMQPQQQYQQESNNQNQYSYQENQQAAPPRVEELQENLSRSSSGSELNREVQHYMVQGTEPEPTGPAPPPAGPSLPMMFNPAQFNNSSQVMAQPSGPGRGLKYGQRRAYPK